MFCFGPKPRLKHCEVFRKLIITWAAWAVKAHEAVSRRFCAGEKPCPAHGYREGKFLVDLSEIEKLDEYVRAHPQDAAGYLDLARAHREAGNLQRAREVLDRLLKNSDKEGAALMLRAELLADQHDWIGAYRDVKESARAGADVPISFRLRLAYRQWLLLANQGWRPEALSRYLSLALCILLGILMLYMAIRELMGGLIIGFMLVLGLGVAFIWAGLAVGGISLWLKQLEDRLHPGWDIPLQRGKQKKNLKRSEA